MLSECGTLTTEGNHNLDLPTRDEIEAIDTREVGVFGSATHCPCSLTSFSISAMILSSVILTFCLCWERNPYRQITGLKHEGGVGGEDENLHQDLAVLLKKPFMRPVLNHIQYLLGKGIPYVQYQRAHWP